MSAIRTFERGAPLPPTPYAERADASANLVELFLHWAAQRKGAIMLAAKKDGQWQITSWAEAHHYVASLSAGLLNLGIKAGDRVMLVSENRPEWCLADLAIMGAGAITVPAYTTNTSADHAHILANSGAAAVTKTSITR